MAHCNVTKTQIYMYLQILHLISAYIPFNPTYSSFLNERVNQKLNKNIRCWPKANILAILWVWFVTLVSHTPCVIYLMKGLLLSWGSSQ